MKGAIGRGHDLVEKNRKDLRVTQCKTSDRRMSADKEQMSED